MSFAQRKPMPTQPFIPPGSVNEYQLRLGGKGRYVHSVSGCTWDVQVKLWDPWERVPYLSSLEVCSRRGAIQIHVYLYLYLTDLHFYNNTRIADKYFLFARQPCRPSGIVHVGVVCAYVCLFSQKLKNYWWEIDVTWWKYVLRYSTVITFR